MSHDFEIAIRDTGEADKDFLRRLHHSAYRDVVERQFGGWDEAQQDAYFDKDWNPGQYQIVELEGEAVGAFCVEECADHLLLKEIQVFPDFQRKGIGSRMLQKVINEAEFMGVNVRLRVLKENPARGLYEKFGFLQTGETDTHFLMEKVL